MGTGSLTDRAAGQTILEGFFNDIHDALEGDFVGRDPSSGVPASGKSLGTTAFPWGAVRAGSLVLGGSVVDTSKITSAQNRIISGATRATSNQPLYIDPIGAAGGASFTVLGASTNLVVDINGTEVTVSTDIVKGSLALAPSTNNTALVDDTDAVDQDDTRTWGETVFGNRDITIDTAGTEITTLLGSWQVFKIAGTTNEFFTAWIESATLLTKAFRGFFYNESGVPQNRAAFSNNDVITLMKTHWIFVENDGTTIDTTVNNPSYSFTAPTSPATGDYWLDLDNQTWKRYDGVTFQIINRTFIGMAITDETDCVVARSTDFSRGFSDFNDLDLEQETSEKVRAAHFYAQTNVYGEDIFFGSTLPTWNITTDLATSVDMYAATEQASTVYYMYLTDEAEEIISDISPHDRPDLRGLYHPHNPWRFVGLAFNDDTSDFDGASGALDSSPNEMLVHSGNGHGSGNTKVRRWTTVQTNVGAAFTLVQDATNGDLVTVNQNGVYSLFITDSDASTASNFGFSKNSTSFTTNIGSLSAAEVLAFTAAAAAILTTTGVTARLKKGDLIAAHDEGLNDAGGFGARWFMAKVSN